jgi:hypothetical protein
MKVRLDYFSRCHWQFVKTKTFLMEAYFERNSSLQCNPLQRQSQCPMCPEFLNPHTLYECIFCPDNNDTEIVFEGGCTVMKSFSQSRLPLKTFLFSRTVTALNLNTKGHGEYWCHLETPLPQFKDDMFSMSVSMEDTSSYILSVRLVRRSITFIKVIALLLKGYFWLYRCYFISSLCISEF